MKDNDFRKYHKNMWMYYDLIYLRNLYDLEGER